MKKRWIVCPVLAIALSACSTGGEKRTIVEESGQALSVMNASSLNPQIIMSVNKMDRLEGIKGVKWISNREIVYIKSIKNRESEGVRDLLSGETKDEKSWNSQETRLLSPNQKHIYVVNRTQTGENIEARHTIENIESSHVKPVSFEAVSGEGLWLDNEHVLYKGGIGDGGVVMVDLNGAVTPMPELSRIMNKDNSKYTENTVKADNRLYFQESDYPNGIHNLNYIALRDLHKPQVTTVSKDVLRFRPSPDGQKIALIKKSSSESSEYEMTLIDSEGKQLGNVVAKATHIEQMSWSPDGSKLAYGTTMAGGENQVYVLDLKSGSTSSIFECERFDGDILWSPDGKQLMVPSNLSKSGVDYLPVTNILQFN
ncbi:hypothetical protein GC102_22535 [Paenibacillus sp. LMG 31460]|uniref:TolB protein n=1 Tax=Paenibacillus germinis TaxID=2654979 RepID=A0ABX1Z869_9BACL|nr:PD40 domain-containing protein [Paenibacillus germinis]NOU88509.1 hypothetical protein [Paenibacillus germinis]